MLYELVQKVRKYISKEKFAELQKELIRLRQSGGDGQLNQKTVIETLCQLVGRPLVQQLLSEVRTPSQNQGEQQAQSNDQNSKVLQRDKSVRLTVFFWMAA